MATRGSDGTWITDERLTFREVREFIEDCLSSRPSFYESELLTKKTNSVAELIETLAALTEVIPNNVACTMSVAEKCEIQNRAVSRLRRALERGVPLEQQQDIFRVQWKILESHGKIFPDVAEENCRLHANPHRRQDDQRLEYLLGLATPDEKWIGLDLFDGYWALIYKEANTAVLECGEVGNATYIIGADQWKRLSRLSKSQLLLWHSDEIRAYNHTSRWRRAIRLAFRRLGILDENWRQKRD